MNRLGSLQRLLLTTAGNWSSRQALLILIYHRVLAAPDELLPGEPTATEFATQMDLLGSLCHVLPLAEAVERLQAGTLPPRAACITFDDGYANNLELAGPILGERGLPALVFVATGFMAGGCMWNDIVIEAVRAATAPLDLREWGLGTPQPGDAAARIRLLDRLLPALKYLPPAERAEKALALAEQAGAVLPAQPMMSAEQLRALGRHGMAIGAHTVNHPILEAVDAREAEREIADSKAVLEALSGQPVQFFAYPNGRPGSDYSRIHVDMVRRCGFTAAVSTAWGAAVAGSDPYQLPRMLPWDRSAFRFGLRLMRSYRDRHSQRV